MHRSIRPLSLCLLTLSSTVFAAEPLDGQHDLEFGDLGQGVAAVEFNLTANAYDSARDLVRMSDGRLLLLAQARVVSAGDDHYRIALARFNADGSVDGTFSGDGKTVPATINPEFDYHPIDLATAPDGKYLALGVRNMLSDQSQPSVMHVCRYNVAGNLDTTFNGTGCNNPVIGILEAKDERAHRVAVQADGSVLIIGQVEVDPDPALDWSGFIYRLTPQGVQDVNFGAGLGYVLLKPPGCDWCTPVGVLAAADGGAYVFGSNQFTVSWVAKVTGTGALDGDFGVGGYALFSFANLNNFLNPRELNSDATRDAQGRLFHCGVVQNGNNNGQRLLTIARLTAEGDLDPTFSGDGRVLMPFNDVTPLSNLRRCAVDGEGRLVVALTIGSEDGLSSDYGVMRFLANGELDPMFNLAGSAVRGVDLGGPGVGHDALEGLVLDQDGVIAAGTSNLINGNTPERKLTLVRFGTDRLLMDGFEQP